MKTPHRWLPRLKLNVKIVFGGIFGIIGALIIVSGHAGTKPMSIEIENGQTSGQAMLLHDTSASNGGAVRLGNKTAPTSGYLRGINVYTLEYQANSPVTPYGEPQSSYNFLASHGMKIIRLSFNWYHLQPGGLDGPIDQSYLNLIKAEAAKIEAAGMKPILDLHNGCEYPDTAGGYNSGSSYPDVWCGNGISTSQATRVWVNLSNAFKADPNIAAYDLFNEPTAPSSSVYYSYTQAVVNAIRANGDNHTLWVESICCNAATVLTKSAPNGPWIIDSQDKIVYSRHMYPGGIDASNRAYQSSDETSLMTEINDLATWCSRWHAKCSVGEVGWPGSNTNSSATSWNALGEKFYDVADANKFDVTYFGGSSAYAYWIWAYDNSSPSFNPASGINRANSQSIIIENHPSQ